MNKSILTLLILCTGILMFTLANSMEPTSKPAQSSPELAIATFAGHCHLCWRLLLVHRIGF